MFARNLVLLLIGAASLVPIGAHAQTRSPAQTPSPYEIFARARDYWRGQIYPSYLAYSVRVTVDEGGKSKTERYTSQYNATNNVVWVDPISDYEIAHPVKVSGANLSFLFIPLSKPLPPIDFLGVPMLAPNYSFGMAPFVPADPPQAADSAQIVAAVRAQFHDPNPRRAAVAPEPLPSGLHEIGSVTAFKREYRIAMLGTETVAGQTCYHLGLTPVRNGRIYRLRELWIDERTYATARLREALNFVDGPGTSVPWTIDFSSVGGAQYIASERADAGMVYRGLIFTHASIAFDHIAVRSLPPQTMLVPPTSDLVMEEPPSP